MSDGTAYNLLKNQSHLFDERYEIRSTIGRGRLSVVYLASRNIKLSNSKSETPPVALKVLLNTEKNSANAIKRIKRESLALLSCIHPAVIRMYDYVARNDLCYLTMEYAKFGDLKNLFSENENFLSPKATLKLVQNLLEGVGAIHAAGILHRDLKPENILLTEDYQVKICDFSVCLLQGERTSIRVLKEIVGTIDYLPPECLKGSAYSVSSDLYSVAVTCFELLSGYKPFGSASLSESLDRKLKAVIEPLPESVLGEYPELNKFFKVALASNPSERFSSHKEMSKALDDVLSGKFNSSKTSALSKEEPDHSEEEFSSIKSILSRISLDVGQLKTKLRKLYKYFFTSFILTLLFFSFLQSGFAGEKDEGSGIGSNSQENAVSIKSLLTPKIGIGVIRGLYTKNKDYRFVISPLSDSTVLFSLMVKGWEPVEVEISARHSTSLHVVGKGIDLILYFENGRNENMLKGRFENLLTGRSDVWELRFP